MLRDQSLVPLSRQHQHALALCVRIDRASPVGAGDLETWQAEIARLVESEIRIHFAAEEQVVFPAARRFEELRPLVDELMGEHGVLRQDFACAEGRAMRADRLAEFGRRLSAHIRKEERLLFERMQKLLSPAELAELGARLEDALKDATQACDVSAGKTKRPRLV
jgi:hemerythrin-like domain-containing protein